MTNAFRAANGAASRRGGSRSRRLRSCRRAGRRTARADLRPNDQPGHLPALWLRRSRLRLRCRLVYAGPASCSTTPGSPSAPADRPLVRSLSRGMASWPRLTRSGHVAPLARDSLQARQVVGHHAAGGDEPQGTSRWIGALRPPSTKTAHDGLGRLVERPRSSTGHGPRRRRRKSDPERCRAASVDRRGARRVWPAASRSRHRRRLARHRHQIQPGEADQLAVAATSSAHRPSPSWSKHDSIGRSARRCPPG